MSADLATSAAHAAASKGFFARLKASLSRGGVSLARDLKALVGARRIDASIMDDLETRLLQADVGVDATTAVLTELQRKVARNELNDVDALLAALKSQLLAILAPCQQPLSVEPSARPFVILVVGVNGSGKTTSIGKLAQRSAAQGMKVMLAAGDTFRAAASEQLQIWAQRSGASLVAQHHGADPGAVLFDALQSARARGTDLLIADTAGRLQSQTHLMEELKKVKRVLQRVDSAAPHEILLVLDANQGQNALAQAEQFNAALGVTGLVVTKLDGTARGGIVVAIARKLRLPIRFVGIGEQIDDFAEFNAESFVNALVGEA
jgi:fused signal recognition particle receptor